MTLSNDAPHRPVSPNTTCSPAAKLGAAARTTEQVGELRAPNFYASRGQLGIINELDHCLGYLAPGSPQERQFLPRDHYFHPYEAKSLIEHAPEWNGILPQLQLVSLLSVLALAGRSLTITLCGHTIRPDPSAALDLLCHLHSRGWTLDACRPPRTCIGSYEGDFAECAKRVFFDAYPELLAHRFSHPPIDESSAAPGTEATLEPRTQMPLSDARKAACQVHLEKLSGLLGETIASRTREHFASANKVDPSTL